MAANYMNESYDRCMAELRARYSGRGVSVNARNTAKAQIAVDLLVQLRNKALDAYNELKNIGG